MPNVMNRTPNSVHHNLPYLPMECSLCYLRWVYKQNIVFKVNVIHEIFLELLHAGVQGAPGIARAVRQGEVVRNLHDGVQRLTMMVMFHAHHSDWRAGLFMHSLR